MVTELNPYVSCVCAKWVDCKQWFQSYLENGKRSQSPTFTI